METERTDVGYNRREVDGVTFMNLEFTTGIRDMIEAGDIPEWLLVEVLVKLPAKIVFRFKLVSKHWLSIISDPYFVREYSSRASKTWTYVYHHMHSKGSARFPVLEDIHSQVLVPGYHELPLPSTQQTCYGQRYMITGVSNGLVLYAAIPPKFDEGTVSSYYICNPITGQWVVLPPFNCAFYTESCGFVTHVEDGVLKSYRVVRLNGMVFDQDILDANIMSFEVFYSEIGEWKSFSVSSEQEIWFSPWRNATDVNGILHWVVDNYGIIAYDPYQIPGQVRNIAFPCDIMNRHFQDNCLCGAYQGKLGYFETDGRCPRFKLWVLNDYSSGDWCLLHFVDSSSDVQCDIGLRIKRMLKPLSFHPFDSDVVELGYEDLLLSYNIKTRKLDVQRRCSTSKPVGYYPIWIYAYLLMIPPWPLSIP